MLATRMHACWLTHWSPVTDVNMSELGLTDSSHWLRTWLEVFFFVLHQVINWSILGNKLERNLHPNAKICLKKKKKFKMPSTKYWPFCSGLNAFRIDFHRDSCDIIIVLQIIKEIHHSNNSILLQYTWKLWHHKREIDRACVEIL